MSNSPDNESTEAVSTGQAIEPDEVSAPEVLEDQRDRGQGSRISDTFPSGFFIGPDRR